MNAKKFYITTAIPYVNAKPHVGHALEFVQADTIARYHRLLGEDARLLSGSDENALKNVQAAEVAGKYVTDFVNENSVLFENLAQKLNVKFDYFQKGSNPDHYTSSQELWKKCEAKGDIYKKDYSGFYCIGCELFYEKDELNEEGECFEHPGKPLQSVSETNYFFRLSNYQNEIEELLGSNTLKIIPTSRKNEMLAFVKKGLEDISISRSNERAKNWGVPVPGDNSQRMYVWFDALNIYRSGLGKDHDEIWPADIHVIGKGITRFHAIYWPAFLLSAAISLPKSLFVHGYFTVDGQKMSKTLGNVVDPIGLIDKYGTDAIRYYLLSQIPSTDDGDFSEEKLKIVYNADLVNGLGNLVSRVAKLCENANFVFTDSEIHVQDTTLKSSAYNFLAEISNIWSMIKITDGTLSEDEPWKISDSGKLNERLFSYVSSIVDIAHHLKPYLPETSNRILKIFNGRIAAVNPALFPRIS